MLKGKKITGPTHDSPRVIVSVWFKAEENHLRQVFLHIVKLLINSLGEGFGNKAWNKCHGLNYYDGLQMSYEA